MRRNRVKALLLAGAFLVLAPRPLAAADAIPNWAVPKPSGRSALLGISASLVFNAVAPCRLVDTRGFPAVISGGGPLAGGASRDLTLTTGTAPSWSPCGIPSNAVAISLNITVVNTGGPGFLQIYPQGGSPGGVSTINYVAGQVIANAAIVPLSATGAVTVTAGVSGTDVIIDTNGYFGSNALGLGLDIRANMPTSPLYVANVSSTCGNGCGFWTQVYSGSAGASAIQADMFGGGAHNYAVFAQAQGTGGGNPPVAAEYSGGVWGKALDTTSNVAGVIGETVSSAPYADGVLGIASASNANAGQFYNTGSSVNVYLATGIDGLTTGAKITGGSLAISGSKAFISPHPDDPSKEIEYIAVEAPTADVTFRGIGRLVNGVARIEVPEHFRLTAREDSYMTTLTPIGSRGFLLAVESQGPEGIVVRGPGDGEFNYVVYAERDVMRDHRAVQPNVDFTPAMLAKIDSVRFMPERMRSLLVKNGTMNADGTFNETTARQLGWILPAPPAPAAAASGGAIEKP